MTPKEMAKLIENKAKNHRRFLASSKEAERYYRNENDILRKSRKSREVEPLRNADNRIPRNFHGLLVNQKAAYMFTAPPLFDVGNKKNNLKIADILGDCYAKVCKDLCVNASNSSVAWLHYWITEEGTFEYGVIDSKQIIPIFSSDLNQKLLGLFRNYKILDETDGKEIVIWEYWTEKESFAFQTKAKGYSHLDLQYYPLYSDSPDVEDGYYLPHNYGEVPFIPFYNNNIEKNDLNDIKPLIDAYDKVFSGFLNDLEDTQEIIFVLTNYGGTDLEEFLHDLKKYKTIQLDDDGSGDGKGNLETLTISIPIEAREKFLEITRKAIFEQGMGVDPDPQKFGNASGVALKYLYSLLELKAGFMETEFKLSFARLVRAICRYLGVECKRVIQTWTRTAVTNDLEMAEICQKSVGIVSSESILKAHPLVEDADKEKEQLELEEKQAQEKADLYIGTFQTKTTEVADEEEQGVKKDGKSD